MKKHIAVVCYDDKTPTDPITANAVVMRDTLNQAGYDAVLVHQWSLDERARSRASPFKTAKDWKRYDGVVLAGSFYYSWPLVELILSQRPVICTNVGYVDDLGLGDAVHEDAAQQYYTVQTKGHAITAGQSVGGLDVGSHVWMDATWSLNHKVTVLVTTMAGNVVLAAHNKRPMVYFGWYRMTDAAAGSPLFSLLTNAAKWAF